MKPILFNTDMVRAIQKGTKTATRRVAKGASPEWNFVGIEERPYEQRIKADGEIYPKELDLPHAVFSAGDGYYDFPMIKLPYLPGDILYVRETWRVQSAHRFEADVRIEFKAGGGMARIQFPGGGDQYHSRTRYDIFVHRWADGRWHPSIHMPREAARIFLRVTDVRVERLQDITEEQAEKEGCTARGGNLALDEFEEVWHRTLNPADRALCGWDANPWVWVIEFERCEKPEGD